MQIRRRFLLGVATLGGLTISGCQELMTESKPEGTGESVEGEIELQNIDEEEHSIEFELFAGEVDPDDSDPVLSERTTLNASDGDVAVDEEHHFTTDTHSSYVIRAKLADGPWTTATVTRVEGETIILVDEGGDIEILVAVTGNSR